MLIKDVHRNPFPVSFSQLPVLLDPSSLYIFPVLFLRIGVELVPEELEVGLFLLFYLHADAHIAFRVAQRLQFLVDDSGIGDIMHGELVAALGGASAADDGHLGWRELADPAGWDGTTVSSLAGLDRWQVVHKHKIIDVIERNQGRCFGYQVFIDLLRVLPVSESSLSISLNEFLSLLMFDRKLDTSICAFGGGSTLAFYSSSFRLNLVGEVEYFTVFSALKVP